MFAAARRPLLARGRVLRLPARLYYGPVQQALEARLQERFDPVHMEVQNESHGAVENESHFHVLLVTPEFEGKRALQQHRLLPQLLPRPPRWRRQHRLLLLRPLRLLARSKCACPTLATSRTWP